MKSMKSTGGLIDARRGGIDEKQRTRWLMSLPMCSLVNDAMQSFTQTAFATSLQHQEMSATSILKDNKDSQKMFEFLEQNNPFECTDSNLRSISSGIVAISESVNAHKAKEVGENILKKMYTQNVFKFSFCRKDCIIQLGKEKCVKQDRW